MTSIRPYEKLLLDTPPMTVQRELAVALESLDKALVLQQLHYYIGRARENNNEFVFREGRWWVYNSYPQWKEDHFPFWSEAKIGRIFRSLEKDGLVTGKQLSSHHYDRRKWYTINYDKVDELLKCTVDDSKLTRCTASDCNDAPRQVDTVMSETSSQPSSHTRPPVGTFELQFAQRQEGGIVPQGWREASEEEYRICERVALHWRAGILPKHAKGIEQQLEGASELLLMHDGDLRATLLTLDRYHLRYEEDGREFTVSGPQSLVNEIPAFLARNGGQDAAAIEREKFRREMESSAAYKAFGENNDN